VKTIKIKNYGLKNRKDSRKNCRRERERERERERGGRREKCVLKN